MPFHMVVQILFSTDIFAIYMVKDALKSVGKTHTFLVNSKNLAFCKYFPNIFGSKHLNTKAESSLNRKCGWVADRWIMVFLH